MPLARRAVIVTALVAAIVCFRLLSLLIAGEGIEADAASPQAKHRITTPHAKHVDSLEDGSTLGAAAGVTRPADSTTSATAREWSLLEADDEKMWQRARERASGPKVAAQYSQPKVRSPRADVHRPFRFHIYDIPSKYIDGALQLLEHHWPNSYCNRHKTKTNYTMLDWRHAHSLFTVDVFIAKYLRFHPLHTDDPNEADVFIIPMMTHVYNCAGVMHYTIEILAWVTQFQYYRDYNQHDHFLFWWRWGMHYNSVLRFWKRVQRHFPNVNLISFDFLEIMGRNEFQDFTLALKPRFLQSMNSIIVPYPDFNPHFSDANKMRDDAMSQGKQRDVFFFFSGTSTIGGIRRWIKRNCEQHPKDCVFTDFATNVIDTARLSVPVEYPQMMARSVFCGHAAGDALSSRRPTSSVLAGCIPVLICDLCIYAFENFIDYESFAVFVAEDDVIDGKLFDVLHAIPQERIVELQRNLAKVRPHFVYNTSGPPSQGDALDMLVKELQLRGSVLRQYKRWWYSNKQLSSDLKDYPPDPRPVKRYLRRDGRSAAEEKDFNNLQGRKV